MKSFLEMLKNLSELQALDSQIKSLQRTDSSAFDIHTKATEVEQIKGSEKRLVQSLEEMRTIRNQTMGALELCRQQIMKEEAIVKLIKVPSEFQGVEKRIEQLRRLEEDLEFKAAGIEKETLRLNAQMEELKNKIEILASGMEELRHLKTRKREEIEPRVREIDALKIQVNVRIPIAVLGLYQRLLSIRAGVAIAKLRGNSCGQCHIVLPPQFVIQLSRSSKLVQCPACQRILIPEISEEGRS